jgi:hypothetical protein
VEKVKHGMNLKENLSGVARVVEMDLKKKKEK